MKTKIAAIAYVILTLVLLVFMGLALWGYEDEVRELESKIPEEKKEVEPLTADEYRDNSFTFTDSLECVYVSTYSDTNEDDVQMEGDKAMYTTKIKKAKSEFATASNLDQEYPLQKVFETGEYIYYTNVAIDGYVSTIGINKVSGEYMSAEVSKTYDFVATSRGWCEDQ